MRGEVMMSKNDGPVVGDGNLDVFGWAVIGLA